MFPADIWNWIAEESAAKKGKVLATSKTQRGLNLAMPAQPERARDGSNDSGRIPARATTTDQQTTDREGQQS